MISSQTTTEPPGSHTLTPVVLKKRQPAISSWKHTLALYRNSECRGALLVLAQANSFSALTHARARSGSHMCINYRRANLSTYIQHRLAQGVLEL